MDAKQRVDMMLDEVAALLYGVPYDSLRAGEQMQCIYEAASHFAERQLEAADAARKAEREQP